MSHQSYDYRGTQQQINFCRDMLYGWRVGWPEYIPNEKDDFPALYSIANKCAKISQVSLDEEEGYAKIKNGIARIAAFCRDSLKWQVLNLFKIDAALQSILIEMQAYSRAKASEQEKLKANERYFSDQQKKRTEDEREMEKARIESLKWSINEWDYIWEYSEMVAKATNYTTCLNEEQSLKALKERGEDFITALKEATEARREKWKLELKKNQR